MGQKVCPRCGAQYATLKSATCPQCFAKLVEVDDDTAAEMAAARAAIERSPEYQAAKAEEDERFRHQSFQACLAVIAMAVLVAVFTVAIVVSAVRHRHHAGSHGVRIQASVPSTVAARPEDVMPAGIGDFKREKVDRPETLSGTLSLIYHAAYRPVDGAGSIDVYAIAYDRPPAEIARFRDVVQLAALAGAGQRSTVEVIAKPFVYEIVGAPGEDAENEDFRRAFARQVGGA